MSFPLVCDVLMTNKLDKLLSVRLKKALFLWCLEGYLI